MKYIQNRIFQTLRTHSRYFTVFYTLPKNISLCRTDFSSLHYIAKTLQTNERTHKRHLVPGLPSPPCHVTEVFLTDAGSSGSVSQLCFLTAESQYTRSIDHAQEHSLRERVGVVQPWQEKALGRPCSSLPGLKGHLKESRRLFTSGCSGRRDKGFKLSESRFKY